MFSTSKGSPDFKESPLATGASVKSKRPLLVVVEVVVVTVALAVEVEPPRVNPRVVVPRPTPIPAML